MCCWAIFWGGFAPAWAQEAKTVSEALQAKINAALARAKASPMAQQVPLGTGQGSLTVYARIKAGEPADSPAIVQQIQSIQARIDNGGYDNSQEPTHHIYEATCDAMLLADTDPVANKPRLEKLRDYLVKKQLANGAWYYPVLPANTAGDTSITQFGILGLWAAHRSGVEVPRDAFVRAAKWLTSTQRNDGSFGYHPFEEMTGPQAIRESMTAAGYGSIAIVKLVLYGEPGRAASTPVARRKFGVLEPAARDEQKAVASVRRAPADHENISRDVLDKSMNSAARVLAERFPTGFAGAFPTYYLYACERGATINDIDRFGAHDWYEEGVDYLLATQTPAGDWGGAYPGPNTAFAMLFLSRATKSLIKPVRRERLVGGGLLAGGRGLPDELDRVDVQNGAVKQRLKKGPIDELLGQLEQPQELSLPSIQAAVVESVSLDNPQELVGQLDRLQGLLRHPSAEVRQVAVWALGRSGEYRMAPQLIARLSDPDRIVAWEANMSLCVLSRRPLGVTPLNGTNLLPIAPPEVTAEEANSQAAYQRWHDQTKAAWEAWYLRVRPYEERDDRKQLPRK